MFKPSVVPNDLEVLHFDEWPGRIFHCPIAPSTNTYIMDVLRRDRNQLINYDVMWTDYQNQGRGRRGRKWIVPTPEEGKVLTFSILFSFDLDNENKIYHRSSKNKSFKLENINSLSQVAAWTWATLMREAGAKVNLKWPNDIIIHKKKLAGFLTETIIVDKVFFMVLGMGINLVFNETFLKRLETETGRQVISLQECLPINKEDINKRNILNPRNALKKFLKKFLSFFELWQVEGFAPFVESWKELSDLIGQQVSLNGILGQKKKQKVVVEDIARNGYLIVREKGVRKTIDFGEIEY